MRVLECECECAFEYAVVPDAVVTAGETGGGEIGECCVSTGDSAGPCGRPCAREGSSMCAVGETVDADADVGADAGAGTAAAAPMDG